MAAQINTIESKQSPITGLPSADAVSRRQPEASLAPGLAGLSQGLSTLGTGLAAQQAEEQRVQNEQQYQAGMADASSRRSAATIEWTQNLEARKAAVQGPDDLTNFFPTFVDDFKQYKADTVAAVQDPRARAHLAQEMDALQSHFAVQAIDFQAKRTVQFRGDQLAQNVDQDRQSVYKDPSLYQTVLDANLRAIEAAQLPPELKTHLRDHAKQNLTMDAARGWVDLNPAAAYARITGNVQDRPMLPPPAPTPTTAPGFQATSGEPTREDVIAEARRQGVPPELALSIWQQESSSGANTATSSKGAKGGFQVMPDTFRELQKGGAVPAQMSNEGMGNMIAGVAYLKRGLDASGGDARQTAKFYYGGPGALQGDESITSGPNTPTRGQYADRVVARMKSMAPEDLKLASAEPTSMTDVGAGVVTSPYRGASSARDTNEPIGVAPYDNAEPPQKEQIKAYAEAQMRKGQVAGRAQLEREVKAGMSDEDNGRVSPQIPVERFRAVYDPGTADEKFAEYNDHRLFGNVVRTISTMPADEGLRVVEGMRPDPASPDRATGDKLYNQASKAWAHVQEARNKDPRLALHLQGVAPIEPINLSGPDLVEQLQRRQASTQQTRGVYTDSANPFTVAEASSLARELAARSGTERISMLRTLGKGLDDPGIYQAALQQIRPDSPVTGAIGNLLQMGQTRQYQNWLSPNVDLSPDAAARRIDVGESLLNPTKGQKAEDGKPKEAWPMPSESGPNSMQAFFSDKEGDAFRGNPVGRQIAYQAYRAYYAGKASEVGITDKSSRNDTIAQEAFDAATGGVVSVNGKSVITPWGMPKGDFKAALDTEYKRTAATAGWELPPLSDVTVRNWAGHGDRYFVESANGIPLHDSRGYPLVLNLTPGDASRVSQIPQ
jgi:soluble lytic murein transglycosylase-like protein